MDFTELLNQAWVWITSIVGSIGLGTLVSYIVALVKSMSFKHDIQPIVESELKKVYEYSVAVCEKEIDVVKGQYARILGVLEALSKYFDNSIGVSEEAKEELKSAIAEAKEDAEILEPVESTPIVEEPKEQPKETKVATTKASR